MMKFYYEGEVLSNGDVLASKWKGTTRAPTEAKAISNLKYRFKVDYDYSKYMPLELRGSLTRVA